MPDTATKSATGTQAPGPEPGRGPTEPVATESAPGRRGRHRKPRPRRVLFAVGGLALAAGALSLLRLGSAPTGEGGGVKAVDIEPRVASSTEDAAQDDAAAVVPGAPTASASPSPTTVVGSAGATPAAGQAGQPGQAGKAGQAGESRQARAWQADPGVTRPATAPPGAPQGPRPITTTPPTEAAHPPRQPAPQPPAATPSKQAPHPTGTAQPPAPNPKPPGLCLPIVGLCLDEGW